MKKLSIILFAILPVLVVASFLTIITADVSIMNKALQDLKIEFD